MGDAAAGGASSLEGQRITRFIIAAERYYFGASTPAEVRVLREALLMARDGRSPLTPDEDPEDIRAFLLART